MPLRRGGGRGRLAGRSRQVRPSPSSLTRITFPYLIFISLVSLFSGILNSLSRFAAAAFAPALLNVALVGALLLFPQGGDDAPRRAMAIAVLVGGVLQFGCCWVAARRAGAQAALRPAADDARGSRSSSGLILPATLAAGGLSDQPVLLRLFPDPLRRRRAELSCNYADRLNQLPLAIIGIGARGRDPARDQPPYRRRRGRAGRRRPGPGARTGDAADPARRARAGGRRGADHRRLVPGRRIYAPRMRDRPR